MHALAELDQAEHLFSRIHGMSRDTASSTIAWVDGPNAVRSAC